MFFVNGGKNAFLVVTVKYILSKLYSFCIHNCHFYNFLETRICFVEKLFKFFLGLCIYFLQKSLKMIL